MRRAYGSGSILTRLATDGERVYYAKFRDVNGRQVKRRLGPARTPHKPDGLTKSMAEARLRDLMQSIEATAPVEVARTLSDAADAWYSHLEATGSKDSSIRASRAALTKWFIPDLGSRSLTRITTADIENAMRKMRKADLSDKSIRNYVGAIRALFNFALDRRRRWATRNPVDDVTLPKMPTYNDIRYLTGDEAWALVDAAQDGPYRDLDRAMYLTAIQTGLRIGELQALDWRSVDVVHSRIRVRRSWDRKTKAFTTPKSKRSERGVPMSDDVAGELERMFRSYYPDTVEPDPDALVFGDPFKGGPLGHRLMYERLRAAMKQAGIDESHGFHTLRHTYGTRLAGQGVPMRTLQEWMGHRDIQTTQRYADYCPNPAERAIVEAAFARGTNRGTNLPVGARN